MLFSNLPNHPDPIAQPSQITDNDLQIEGANAPTQTPEVIPSSSPSWLDSHFEDAQIEEDMNESETKPKVDDRGMANDENLETPNVDIPIPEMNTRKRKSKSKSFQNALNLQKRSEPPTKRRRLFKKSAKSSNDGSIPQQPVTPIILEEMIPRHSNVSDTARRYSKLIERVRMMTKLVITNLVYQDLLNIVEFDLPWFSSSRDRFGVLQSRQKGLENLHLSGGIRQVH